MKRSAYTTVLTKVDYVNASGDAISLPEPQAPAKRAALEPEPRHMGWRVYGHPKGAVERAKAAREAQIADWRAMTEDDRARSIRGGEREPKPWDEDEWLRHNKPKSISRGFQVRQAAFDFAELAKSSYERIFVREVVVGEAQ